MSEETLNELLESIDNTFWDLKHNKCNVDTEEKGWKTYYGLDDNLIKHIRKLEIRVEQLENIRKDAIEFCQKYDFILKWQMLDILNKGSENNESL